MPVPLYESLSISTLSAMGCIHAVVVRTDVRGGDGAGLVVGARVFAINYSERDL